MRKSLSIIIAVSLSLSFSGCTELLEPVYISELESKKTEQEKFKIEIYPLTFSAVEKLNSTSYERRVSKPGDAFSANLVKETELSSNVFPPNLPNAEYTLGIGDEISLIQQSEEVVRLGVDGAPISSTIITTQGRVGTDGNVLLLGAGNIRAIDRTISELREEVRSILIRAGKTPNFQMEISSFNSKHAYLSTNSGQSAIISITDQRTSIRELIAEQGISYDPEEPTTVEVQRKGKSYILTLSEILATGAQPIYLQDGDHIIFQTLKYKGSKVFLVGGVTPTILSIRPEDRQTLADALFQQGGPLDRASAQRSAVYLLRGRNPVNAYHLDAQNPVRLLVADALELRPDDIVYVSEQPIGTLNRTIETLVPINNVLRMLTGSI